MKELLELIETVDPSDTDKLDEIDARVKCYVLQWKPDHPLYTWDDKPFPFWQGPSVQEGLPKYTRSRDALKAIRPHGYFSVDEIGSKAWQAWINRPDEGEGPCFLITGMPTEELAELHAIIQAIAYERAQ